MPCPFPIAAFVIALFWTIAAGVAEDVAVPAGNYSGSLVFEHDREAAEGLAQARRELAAGQTAAGLSRLQQLLDRSGDVLIEDGDRYVSVWEAANHVLAGLTPVDRDSYARIIEDASRHEFQLASHPVDHERLVRLTIRYRHAAVGQEAAVLLTSLAFDRGEWGEASAWCDKALQMTDVRQQPPGLVRLKDRIHAASLARTANDPATTAVPPAGARESSWSLDLEVDPKAVRAIGTALAEFDAQAMTPALAARPLIVDGRIITRTLTGLVCVDAASGELLWKHRVADHASRLARGPGELTNPARNGQVSATLLRRLIRDSLQDELATDGEVVYSVITGERPAESDPSEPANLLRAVEIATGQTKWELGPSQAPRKRFAKKPEPRFFLGPPLIDGDQRLVLTQRRESVELVALAATDGGALWSLPLGQSVRDLWAPGIQNEESPPYDRERQSTACRLSRNGSHVLVSTAAGAVVCVDTLSRRTLWAYRYARGDPRQPPVQGDATHFRQMPLHDSFATAECWQVGGVGVCVAPDADRIFACDLESGQLLWSRPRGDGLQLLSSASGSLLLLEEYGVRSLTINDGTERWFTQISRPAGSGFLTEDDLVVPLEAGGRLVVRLTDGTIIESPSSERPDQSFTISSHPPTGLRPLRLRNLQGTDHLVISQSPTSLERVSITPTNQDERSNTTDSLASSLTPLLRLRSLLEPAIRALRPSESRVMLADSLLLGVLERAGLRQSVEEQAARLVRQLEELHSTNDAAQKTAARRRLEALRPDNLYLTTENGLHSCRLDRWVAHLFQRDSDSTPPFRSPSSDMAGQEIGTDASWPTTMPTVTETTTHFGEPHFLRVPMQAKDDSAWRDVTVEIDRLGRMIQFSTTGRIVPMAVSLPPETGVLRAETDFLQAWGAGDVLLVRCGLELVAFKRKPGGELPDAPLWPPQGKTLALAGPNPPLATSIREAADETSPAWNQSSSGCEDVFGRRLGEVGPVCSDYFCYQDRGHLIAADTHTGRELWRRSRLPVGTWSVGDDEHVVLFRADSPVVMVLSAYDGRIMGNWRLDESPVEAPPSVQSPFEPRLVNGTAALMPPTAEGRQWSCLDMESGRLTWQFNAAVGAQAFAVSESHLGVVEPSKPGRFVVGFYEWQTGKPVRRLEVQGPEELADVVAFQDAEQVYLITSGKITDLRLLNARQILSGAHRRSVNGWLHAFRIADVAHVWSQQVENMAFPIVQPRHVPLLLINDQVHPAEQSIPQGRLICLDKRTGQTVASLTDSLHINYTLETDAEAGRIDVRMRGRTLQLDYKDEEPPM